MKYFEHENAQSFEEASKFIKDAKGTAQVMAGGTDLLGVYKDRILPTYPETVINLKKIPGFDGFTETEDELIIGAGCKLSKIAENEAIKSNAPALAEAAYSVASPLIRNVATIGGNICQDVRCWYYRYPDSVGDALYCKRKGGDTCYAINGENRYHSVFGGMKCHGAACASTCPAGTDIPGYMAEIRKGNWDAAAAIILRYNPMPMLTARVCPHDCQNKCNQNTYGEPVNIHAVERTLGDYILEHADKFYQAPASETGKSTAIIGAGPGGLSAAYYLRKAGQKVVVYDRMEKAGGVLQYGIPHYRLPKTYVDAYVKALEHMGVTFKLGVEVGSDITLEDLNAQYDKLYFGTGAWKQPVLGLDGENLTQFGLNFLVDVNTYLKKAIGNEVLVCGGGNVAMDVALTAIRLGAKKVKLVCLEQEHEMPASAEEVARAKEEGVELHNGWGLSKIVTDANGKVAGLEAMKCLSVRDEHGRFSPVYDNDDKTIFDSDYIILATGQRVDISFLGEKFGEQLKSARGLIEADSESYQTKNPNFYAGGDAVTGPNVAIRAIRAGRIAATNMNKDLGIAAEPTPAKEKFLHFDPVGVDKEKSTKLPELPLGQRSLTAEDAASLDIAAAAEEAKRCMNCACYAVNPSDITPVLIALDAKIVTTERTITASDLFTKELTVQDVLNEGELVKEIHVPKNTKHSHYDKKRVRNAIDFATVSLATVFDVKDNVIEDAKIIYGAVAPIPYRMKKVEEFLKGKEITKEVAEEAAALAIEHATPMSKNEYKLYMMKDVLREAILRELK